MRHMGGTCDGGTAISDGVGKTRTDAARGEGCGAWAGAKGPDLERTHQDPLRRALKDAACSIARGMWADRGGMTAQEAERRWCEDSMPSAQEDDGWRAAALVLAGIEWIEPAVTSAMRALPSSTAHTLCTG